jgi:hypothetical protein
MICFSCLKCSQHVQCPFCGGRTEPNGKIMVGFSLSDLPNPYSWAYNTGRDIGTSATAPSTSSSDSGSSWWDRIPNPFKSAYDAGYAGGGAIQQGVSNLGSDITAPFDALSSLLTVGKYVLIGGVIFVAVVVGYGVIKWIPVALGAAAANVSQVNKMIPDIAAKALR